jgi:hypothetical protein
MTKSTSLRGFSALTASLESSGIAMVKNEVPRMRFGVLSLKLLVLKAEKLEI